MSHAEHRERGQHASAPPVGRLTDLGRRLQVSVLLTLPILLLSPLLKSLPGFELLQDFRGTPILAFLFASVLFFYAGWPFLRGWAAEMNQRRPAAMTLIGMAITVVYLDTGLVAAGLPGHLAFLEFALLINIILFGQWLVVRSVMRVSGSPDALAGLLPTQGHRLRRDNSVEDVAIDSLKRGDRILVQPGETVPTDGVISTGTTRLDRSMFTGEKIPVAGMPGQQALAGSLNIEAPIKVRVTAYGAQCYLGKAIDTVREAQSSHSRVRKLADRAAVGATWAVLAVTLLTVLVWLGLGQSLDFTLRRALAVLLIASPQALAVAVPLVIMASAGVSAWNSLLIRNRSAFERARNLHAIIFSKTGILTAGRFDIAGILAFGDFTEEEVLRLAASLEGASEHPVAKGIVRAASERGLELLPTENFSDDSGLGAIAQVDGHRLQVTSTGLAREHGVEPHNAVLERWRDQGHSVIFVLRDDKAIGAIALVDAIRDESRIAVEQLQQMNLRCMLLTGDGEAAARSVAAELALDEYFSEVAPADQASNILELQRRGLRVAMVGDSDRDAPALIQADLGIAVGTGTDLDVRVGDLVLVSGDLRNITTLLALSRAARRKRVQNLALAGGYNLIAIPLAAGVGYSAGILVPLIFAAALMALSTVVIAFNTGLLGRAPVMPRQSFAAAPQRVVADTGQPPRAPRDRPAQSRLHIKGRAQP
ncbi:MAG: heavy metal translocating P-type ATPase [Thiogranum sp.]|nr:heavy metal translocating P-type ATPase [Thiogranum sp.]